MSGFTDRENQLFDILETFNEHDLAFVVIGGFAVSAYQHRFSVDADLVVAAEHLDQFTDVLQAEGYEKTEDRALEEGRFVAYQKDAELPVSVDLMVDAVHTRQTGATWPYEELTEHAEPQEIQGSVASVTVPIPKKELLLAMKLHSGRSTDARDAVALAGDVDFERVAAYMDRGDPARLRSVLGQVLDTITSDEFADAFKGVFVEQELPDEQIERVQAVLREQIDEHGSE